MGGLLIAIAPAWLVGMLLAGVLMTFARTPEVLPLIALDTVLAIELLLCILVWRWAVHLRQADDSRSFAMGLYIAAALMAVVWIGTLVALL
jgi:hypothetical protein